MSPGCGCSSNRSGIASGAQQASSRNNPAAVVPDCSRWANASAQVVATVPGYPAGPPRVSMSPRRRWNKARYPARLPPLAWM